MAITNLSKSSVTNSMPSKSNQILWADTVATWADSMYRWELDGRLPTDVAKSSVVISNLPKS